MHLWFSFTCAVHAQAVEAALAAISNLISSENVRSVFAFNGGVHLLEKLLRLGDQSQYFIQVFVQASAYSQRPEGAFVAIIRFLGAGGHT